MRITKEHFQNLGRAGLLIGWVFFCVYFFTQLGKSSNAHLMRARSVGIMGLLPPLQKKMVKQEERKTNHVSK